MGADGRHHRRAAWLLLGLGAGACRPARRVRFQISVFVWQVPRADGYPDRGSLRDISLCGCVHDQDPAGDRHCLVPEHNPLVLAKTVATVDRLSGGRFIFGVGVGWLAEEFQALGISFDRRAQRTREYIDVMRKLWTQRRSSHQGEFVNFTNVLSYPKPVSEKGVPIWFGGESGPALRRIAEYGDGWIGFNLLPDQAAAKIK